MNQCYCLSERALNYNLQSISAPATKESGSQDYSSYVAISATRHSYTDGEIHASSY